MEERKSIKGPFIGGCILGLVIGIVICCIGMSIISFVFSFRPRHIEVYDFGSYTSRSTTEVLGRYELAGADDVNELNSRVKQYFTERGFKELEDMPLRSLERMPLRGGIGPWERRSKGNWDWDVPGVVLLLKLDDQSSIYILVPDWYRRETHSQMIGCRSDFVTTPDKMWDYEKQRDRLKDDFMRAFPSGNYREGLPDDMPGGHVR